MASDVHMLVGRGGNIGNSSGTDGVVVIDDQHAPLPDRTVAAIRTISAGPTRFILNTHGDHAGGNENLGRTPPSPPGALPVMTFTPRVTFHLNGDPSEACHVAHAHSDGDVIINPERWVRTLDTSLGGGR